MRIGIDTLFEHPERPSSAMDYLEILVRMLPAAGPEHEYVVFVSPRNRARFAAFSAPNVQLVNSFVSNENVPLRIAVQQLVLPSLIKRHRVDVLFSPGNVCPLLGNVCRVLKINTLHHYVTPKAIGRMRALYRRVAFGISARRADHVLANTSETKREICRRMKVPERDVSVVFEASYSAYAPMPQAQTQEVCERYHLHPGYLLFVSALYPYKNAETLVRAYAQLHRAGSYDGDLVILGRDQRGQQADLQAIAQELGIADRVRFFGFIALDDLPYLYCGARVFVYPSLMETFGKPLVEAMQCGVPIVASNTSCIPEVAGDAALLVDPLNVEQMAAAIYRAATDEPLRQQLIARGLERAKLFTWENTARETLKVIAKTWEQRKTALAGRAARTTPGSQGAGL